VLLVGKKVSAELSKMAVIMREDDDFISHVLGFLPDEMKQGYVSDDSDVSDADDNVPKTREERQAELREKLHAKLQDLRAKSGSLRAQKNIRKRLNKIEKKQQNKKQRPRKDGVVNSKLNADRVAKKQRMIDNRKGTLPIQNVKPPPVFNTEGKVVFSKFDFASSADPDKVPKVKKVSLKTKLSQAREKQQQKKQTEKGAEADSEAWQTAMKKASGEKVLDDPKLLAKSLRREQQKKKQGKKKWEERMQHEKQKSEERQNKRMTNINARKEQNKKKRVDKLKKKGRILPGF